MSKPALKSYNINLGDLLKLTYSDNGCYLIALCLKPSWNEAGHDYFRIMVIKDYDRFLSDRLPPGTVRSWGINDKSVVEKLG